MLVRKNKKRQTFHLSYFLGKSHFENNEKQNYIVFQPDFKYFKTPSAKNIQIVAWKCNGLSEESIKSLITSDNSFAPGMTF